MANDFFLFTFYFAVFFIRFSACVYVSYITLYIGYLQKIDFRLFSMVFMPELNVQISDCS